jgi:hypothetical protein
MTTRGVEVELQFFVTAALDRSECLAAKSPHFISEPPPPKKKNCGIYRLVRWVGCRLVNQSDDEDKTLLLSVIELRTSDHAACNLVTCCTDSATGFTRAAPTQLHGSHVLH